MWIVRLDEMYTNLDTCSKIKIQLSSYLYKHTPIPDITVVPLVFSFNRFTRYKRGSWWS